MSKKKRNNRTQKPEKSQEEAQEPTLSADDEKTSDATTPSQEPEASEKDVKAAKDAKEAAKDAKEADKDAEGVAVPRWKKVVREIILLGILVLVIFSARWSLADHYHVPSGSMIPTVEVGDRIVVNKLAYSLRVPFTTWSLFDFEPPQRGDIIVLDSPVEDVVLLKRVVAVPRDTVEVRGGRVWLNGEQVKVERDGEEATEYLGATHTIHLSNGGGPNFGPKTLGSDEFLVMGDNRGNSRDGRSFGLIKMDSILGQAVRIYYRSNDGLTWLTL